MRSRFEQTNHKITWEQMGYLNMDWVLDDIKITVNFVRCNNGTMI